MMLEPTKKCANGTYPNLSFQFSAGSVGPDAVTSGDGLAFKKWDVLKCVKVDNSDP